MANFAQENKMLALGVCFPQPCSSAGHRFAASRSHWHLHYYQPSCLFPEKQVMNCLVNWIQLRIVFARKMPNLTSSGSKDSPHASRRIKFAQEKGTILRNCSWEFFLLDSVLLCLFLGLWSGYANLPLQSLVNQCFSQTLERLVTKQKREGESPWGWSAVKCREFVMKWTRSISLKWTRSISQDYWVHLDMPW